MISNAHTFTRLLSAQLITVFTSFLFIFFPNNFFIHEKFKKLQSKESQFNLEIYFFN
ncbi:hypothetical protein PO909_016866 [Leuciscus waleckii]